MVRRGTPEGVTLRGAGGVRRHISKNVNVNGRGKRLGSATRARPHRRRSVRARARLQHVRSHAPRRTARSLRPVAHLALAERGEPLHEALGGEVGGDAGGLGARLQLAARQGRELLLCDAHLSPPPA